MSLKEWDRFVGNLKSKYRSDWNKVYIESLQYKKRKHIKTLYSQFSKKRAETVEKIESVCRCLESQYSYLSSGEVRFTRLPVLANSVLSNPHALDKKTEVGRLFLHALAIINNEPFAGNALKKAEHYMNAGIIMDDISSNVTCLGLIECKTDGSDINSVWEEACKRKEVLQVPLRNILWLRSIRPRNGNKVFIVENPSVFSIIADRIAAEKPEIPCPAVICSSGYNSLALQELFRGLHLSNDYYQPLELWYSGDFDPEGLQMAQLLIDELGDMVKLWKYSVNDYDSTSSSMEKTQLNKRLNKLKSITDTKLRLVADEIEKTHKVGYQEAIANELASDVVNYIQSI